MNEMVTFVLNLRDMMSSQMAQLARNSASVFTGIDKRMESSQKHFNMAGRSVSDLNARMALLTSHRDLSIGLGDIAKANREIQDLERQINKLQNLGRSGGSGGGGGMNMWSMARGSFIGGLGVQGGMMAGREMIDIAKGSLEKGMDAEQSIIGLATFVGKAQAMNLYKEMQKQAVLTPFTTAAMLPVEMGLVASGMSAARANKDMMNLMNALSATGNAGNSFMFQLMGSHLAQAASAGKIDGLLMREFQRTAHIPITRLLANDMFPKLSVQAGMQKVNDLDSISYDRFTHALDTAGKAGGMFAGALMAQSQTIRGKMSTILDYLGIGQAGAVLNPRMHENIIKLEDRMISVLQGLPEMIDRFQPVFSKMFSDFEYLMPHLKGGIMALVDDLKPLGSVLLSDSMKHFASSALDLSKTLLTDLKPAIQLVAEVARVAAGASGVVLKSVSNDLNFKGMVQAADNYYSHLPEWQRNLPNQGGMSEISKLSHFMTNQYGGKVASWMNDPSQMREWMKTGHFDRSIKPDFVGYPIMQKMGIDIKKMYDPMAAVKRIVDMRSSASVAKNNASGGGTTESADTGTITGGGSKTVHISFRNFTEHFEVNVKDAGQAVKVTESSFEEMFLRLLQSIPGTHH